MTASHFFSSPREVDALPCKDCHCFHDYIIEKLLANEFRGGPTKTPSGALFILLHLHFFLVLSMSHRHLAVFSSLCQSRQVVQRLAQLCLRYCTAHLATGRRREAERCHLPSLTPHNTSPPLYTSKRITFSFSQACVSAWESKMHLNQAIGSCRFYTEYYSWNSDSSTGDQQFESIFFNMKKDVFSIIDLTSQK